MMRWRSVLYPVYSAVTAVCLTALLGGCDGPINSPYPAGEAEASIYYTAYIEPPKHFDPARAYSEDEYRFMQLIYEPPLQFHYLKRPYELIPTTAKAVPVPAYFDKDGNALGEDPPSEDVAKAVYTIELKPGTKYQPHPCFVKNEDGSLFYGKLTEADLADIYDISDFEKTDTRELMAVDYVNQIKRICDRRLECPLFAMFDKYIIGMEDCRKAIDEAIDAERERRKAAAGESYNQEVNERKNPIVIDYTKIPLEGVEVVDKYTYAMTLRQKYPQMKYWMAMPFFSPMPQEAIDFYSQGPLTEVSLVLNRYPVGTGPYRIEEYQPNRFCTLTKNENYRESLYPSEGAPGDKEKGLLKDAGKQLPLTDKIHFVLDKESLPRWSKFMQGYYDQQIIGEETFDQAISVTATGQELTEDMQHKGIGMDSQIRSSVRYMAFNMLDETWGGDSDRARNLRQAVSIAVDNEELISIFENGNGVAAHGPIPPAIVGGVDTTRTCNTYVYNWDDAQGKPVRKSLDDARKLLEEAGYPQGIGPDGKPLELRFLNSWTTARHRPKIEWLRKRLKMIGVQLVNDTPDYSTFREKVLSGNFQMVFWGWNADYPDAENFMFLLYGPNGKVKAKGENAANYDNAKFNELFKEMEAMNDGPQRMKIIDEMTDIIQRDAPWVYLYHEAQYDLSHGWVNNYKPHLLHKYPYEYVRIEPVKRAKEREEWNKPILWPLIGVAAVFAAFAVPAVLIVARDR